MARYRAKTDAFVNGERVRAGKEFTWDGKPGKWMEPVDKEALAKVAALAKGAKSEPAKGAKSEPAKGGKAGGTAAKPEPAPVREEPDGDGDGLA